MSNDFCNRQSLDPLYPPFRGDLAARHAPHLLGVVLEEGAVQTGSEAVREKIFQTNLGRSIRELRPTIAQSDLKSLDQPEILKRTCVHGKRVVEEPASIENSRNTSANQHDRVGSSGRKPLRCQISRLALIVNAQRARSMYI